MKQLILNIFRVNWLITLYFNFRYLTLSKAWRLPVLFWGPCKVGGDGVFNIPEKCNFGMIKLGIKHENSCVSRMGISILNDGICSFAGSGIMGNGTTIEVRKGANLSFGKNFGMTGNISIHCQEQIKIGKNFSCSWNVSIADTDFHQCCDPYTKMLYPMTKPVEIGDNVWCCQNVMIAKGGYIGNWNIIAAYSLVNKFLPYPPYTIMAGVPAVAMKKSSMRVGIERVTRQSDNWQITSGLKIFTELKTL